jgi:hypothetical protein
MNRLSAISGPLSRSWPGSVGRQTSPLLLLVLLACAEDRSGAADARLAPDAHPDAGRLVDGGSDRGMVDATSRDAMPGPDASPDARLPDAALRDATVVLDQQPPPPDAAGRDMARPDLGLDCSPCRGTCQGEPLGCVIGRGCFERCQDVGAWPCVPGENGVESCDESTGTDVRVMQDRGCENNRRADRPEETCAACRGLCRGTCIVNPCPPNWYETCRVGDELQDFLEGCGELNRCDCVRSVVGEGECYEVGTQRVFIRSCD